MNGITNLALAMTAFVGTHFLLSHPLRAPLVGKVGEKGFLGLYSIVGLITFSWVIAARRAIESAPDLWIGGRGAWDSATLVMLFASVLLAGSFVGNPAAPDPSGRTDPIGPARGVFAITRHPMMWSFALWAIVHMILWGSAASLIVSGGILILALGGMAGQDAKKLRLQGARWRNWMDRTSFLPFAGQFSGRIDWKAAWPGWGVAGGGIAIFLIATRVHPLMGGPVAGVWRWIG